MKKYDSKFIILFDGICNLCNSSVNFIIKHDKKNVFLFASLQSDVAKEILLHNTEKNIDITSVILIKQNKIFDKSTAALKIAKELAFPVNLYYAFIVVPTFIRNWVYNFIAKNRYKWFGKKDSCMIPTQEIKEKFL